MPTWPTHRSDGGNVIANAYIPKGHNSSLCSTHSRACASVISSGIIVNRGISGSLHDSAMSAASSTRKGRKQTRSPFNVVNGTATPPRHARSPHHGIALPLPSRLSDVLAFEPGTPDIDISAALEPHDWQRGLEFHEVAHPRLMLWVSPPRPAHDVIRIREQFTERRLSASFPQFGPKQHPLDSATDHTGNSQPPRQIKEHEEIGMCSKRWTRQLVLPFRHPLLRLGEPLHIAFKGRTRDPARPVIQRVQFHVGEPQLRCYSRSHR